MSAVDGMAAARTMIGFGTWRAGYCMEAVWQAFKRNGARTSLGAPTAYDGWLESNGKHPGDRNPPPGVPVYFGPKAGSRAGDVVISLGGGQVVATDWPRNGAIGVTTIDARQRQIGRPYLGWTDTILNHPIAMASAPPAPASGGASAPAQQLKTKEVDMYIAVVNGSWFQIIPQGNAKPRAVVLGGDSGAGGAGLPVIHYTWQPSIDALKAAVEGI